MTFEDDFLLFQLPAGPRRLLCVDMGIAWPPPLTIRLRGFEPPYRDIDFRLLTMSTMTDQERANLSTICRGAQYVLASAPVGATLQ